MDATIVGIIVFTCTFVGALLGMWWGTALPEPLLAESRQTVQVGVGLIATMTALVLGLVTASAKSSFDAVDAAVKQTAIQLLALDRVLARYGSETGEIRKGLQRVVGARIDTIWGRVHPSQPIWTRYTRMQGWQQSDSRTQSGPQHSILLEGIMLHLIIRGVRNRAKFSLSVVPMPVLALVGLALVAVGCATPVGVTQLGLQAGYRLQTESALSAGEPSEPSKTVLRRLGLLDRFEEQPETVLAELHRGLSPAGDEDRLFALAELSFLHAERTGDREYFLASAVYAWALLFPGEAAGAQLQGSDPQLRLAYDFYNQGVAQGLTESRENTPGAMTDEMAEVRLQPGTRTLPFGTMELTLEESGLSWGGYRLERFIPTTTLEVRGLRNRYFRPGLGASLAASLAPGAASAKVVGSERLGPLIKVPVTALLRLEDARASLASGRVRGRVEVYAADHASTVTVDGQVQPLEYDPTAALAYQLDKSPLYAMEIAAFLRAGVFAQYMPRDRTQDGLFMLHPYSPGKIPVVLVHGTLSSPVRWAELVNELEGDPRIRQRFQIWIFLYDTGNPIAYSAGRLRAALTAMLQELDPEGKDPALRRMVVIGHSQGGLLTKLTAIDSGTRFWDRFSSKPFDAIEVNPETRALLKQSAFYTPLPFVERVVFVATPHHGALLATGRVGATAAWLVTLPVGLLAQLAQAATMTGDEKLITALRRPPTAIDNMSPSNPGLQILQSIPVSSRILAHSIIAVEGDGPKEDGNDGVVAYTSAHIDEAVSELVVRSSHSVQGNPQAIEEIRRILLEHAAVPGENR